MGEGEPPYVRDFGISGRSKGAGKVGSGKLIGWCTRGSLGLLFEISPILSAGLIRRKGAIAVIV